jgi:hypothetical protein
MSPKAGCEYMALAELGPATRSLASRGSASSAKLARLGDGAVVPYEGGGTVYALMFVDDDDDDEGSW